MSEYVQLELDCEVDIVKLIDDLKGKIISSEKMLNREMFYIFVPAFKNFIVFKNHKINLAIIKSLSSVVIGYPFVYSGY